MDYYCGGVTTHTHRGKHRRGRTLKERGKKK